MTQVHFNWSNARGASIDSFRADMSDLVETRDHAVRIVRSLTSARDLQDRRNWILRVRDDLGDELFVLPFFLPWLGALKRGYAGRVTETTVSHIVWWNRRQLGRADPQSS